MTLRPGYFSKFDTHHSLDTLTPQLRSLLRRIGSLCPHRGWASRDDDMVQQSNPFLL